MADFSNQIIRDYHLRESIGRGGFGEVYRAIHRSVNREVAIKMILADYASLPEFVERFHNEAAMIGRLEHPHIVPLYDYWQDENGACLVMRWMRGGSLRDRLADGDIDLQTTTSWIEQIGSALHAAHRAKIVHRDLKPANILLDEDANVYLADFGIAKNVTMSVNTDTQSPFTPIYAAPEQFSAEPITPATDIYCFGILIYELLTGHPPFDGSLTELLFSHMNQPLPSIHEHIQTIPPAVDDVLEQATAKQPEHRFSDARTLVDAFKDAFKTGGTSRPARSVMNKNTRNPFFHRGPIRDPAYFFGRSSEVRQIMSLMENGQSLSIIGQRRIGKTSLLYHILDERVLNEFGLAKNDFLMIYLDCGSLITLEQPELYRAFLEEIEDALLEHGIDDMRFEPLERDRPVSYRDFERALRRFFDDGNKLILLLDEFELLSRNLALDTNFFTGLRALAMRYPVIYITASKQPLVELTYADESALSSPFFNIFATIRLSLIPVDAARSMLKALSAQTDFPFDEETIEMLLYIGGTHLMLLQIAAYHELEIRRETGSELVEHLPELRRRFLEAVESHYTYYWRSLSVEEQQVLVTLPLSGEGELSILRSLAQASLIVQAESGTYYPMSEPFYAFALTQSVPGLIQAGEVIIDENRREVVSYGERLDLTPTQFELLKVLVENTGQVIESQALEGFLWGDEYVDDPERLKSVVKGLRRALGDKSNHVDNVRGVGYQWRISI